MRARPIGGATATCDLLTITVDHGVRLAPIPEKEALSVVQGHTVPITHSNADRALKLILEFRVLPGLGPMISRVSIIAAEA